MGSRTSRSSVSWSVEAAAKRTHCDGQRLGTVTPTGHDASARAAPQRGASDAPGLHVVRNWEERTKINHTSQVEKRRDGPALPRSWVWPTEGTRTPGMRASMLVAGGAVSWRHLLLPRLSLEMVTPTSVGEHLLCPPRGGSVILDALLGEQRN